MMQLAMGRKARRQRSHRGLCMLNHFCAGARVLLRGKAESFVEPARCGLNHVRKGVSGGTSLRLFFQHRLLQPPGHTHSLLNDRTGPAFAHGPARIRPCRSLRDLHYRLEHLGRQRDPAGL